MSDAELQAAFLSIREEAVRLAGDLPDLTQRAATYHHLYQHSGGNHAFPLIAAHGALWARGYFTKCQRLARVLSWQYGWNPHHRARQLEKLEAFANRFRDINRRVCIDTYTNYHFTERFGSESAASQFVPPRVLSALNQLHTARIARRVLTIDERKAIFEAHFLNEQEHVVSPVIREALAEFDWPLAKFLSLKPLIRFTFFPAGHYLWFRNFSQREERIAHGLSAFQTAAQVGWDRTAAALREYRLLPEPFFKDSALYFAQLRESVCSCEPS